MSKVRIVNKDGRVKEVNPKFAAKKANLLKQKGWFIEEIEQPKAPEAVKAPVEAVPVDDVIVPELNAPTLEELRKEYKDVLGKKPHHSWKEDTLTQKIEDKKNE